MWFRAREGLLKAEYRDWYPWIVPGIGYRASRLASLVRRQRVTAEPHWELEPRVPSERHFVFRGGFWAWLRIGRHSRRTDHGLALA
jgi:hypothetical protein